MALAFGPFAFDRHSRLLSRDGAEVALPPRVLGVLEVLIARPGEIVARQDLLDGVWKDAFVTDTSLAEAISFLRQALGDDPQAPRYIQTVHRRGYRFLSPLTETRSLTPDGGDRASDRSLTPDPDFSGAGGARFISATTTPSLRWQILPWSVAVFCGALALAAVWRTMRVPAAEPARIARFEIPASPGTTLDHSSPALAVSPDGRVIAWTACETMSASCAL
jgi:DNA-binding winged helix-turn-helix (wHTH) protein